MTTVLSPIPKQQFLDNNGRPLVGGLLFVYEAGTTTKATTYTDSTGATPNSNPVVLDYRGEASVWLDPNVAYKYVLAPAGDTDPPGSVIWTVDNITEAQLLTLYAGVDTGSANTYVLTFSATFTAYVDGTILYWIPSNSNTGASTLNVNGIGPVAIVDQAGNALVAGAIVANSVVAVMYLGGEWLLISNGALGNAGPVLTGTFTPTWFGYGTPPTGDATYTRLGSLVTIRFRTTSDVTATSNTTALAMGNLPAVIRPAGAAVSQPTFPCVIVDNSQDYSAGFGYDSLNDVFTFFVGSPLVEGGFTAANQKGFRRGAALVYVI